MRLAAAAAFLLAFAPMPSLAENVEHPIYKSWARHPVGTTITMRSLTDSPGSRITTTTTYRLMEVRPDRVILEVRKSSDATGTKVEYVPETQVEKRHFPLFPGVRKEDVGNPSDPKAKGRETLTLAGREVACTWYDTRGAVDAGPTETRTWLSEDVPGRIARTVVKVPVASTTITLELVEFRVP